MIGKVFIFSKVLFSAELIILNLRYNLITEKEQKNEKKGNKIMLERFFIKAAPRIIAHPEALGIFVVAGAAIAAYALFTGDGKKESEKNN